MGIFNVFNKKSEDTLSLPYGSKEFGKFLDEEYKDSIDEVKMLNDTLYENVLEYDNIVSSIRDLEVKKTVIEHKIKSELGECEIGFIKERKITWKPVTKTSLDTSRLKSELPEVVNDYSKTKTSRVFRMGR